MNINVMVVNVRGDFGVSDARRRAPQRPCATAGEEEVIELTPQNGAWMRSDYAGTPSDGGYPVLGRRSAVLSYSPDVTTYDRNGNIHSHSERKGLHINTTA